MSFDSMTNDVRSTNWNDVIQSMSFWHLLTSMEVHSMFKLKDCTMVVKWVTHMRVGAGSSPTTVNHHEALL